jgi:HPt (histidine-containing phosphotransfer) domain-containing protein
MAHSMTATTGDFVATEPAATTRARAPKKTNAMAKVFLLVGVAILIFMAFSTYSVTKEIQGSAQLAAIKDLYFPVLQRLDANIVRVDKMEDLYIQVVVAGDRDMIAKADDLAAQTDGAFAELNTLYKGRGADISRLRAGLKQYQSLATKASIAFLDQTGADMAALAGDMNKALADLRTNLVSFRKSSYGEFVDTLAGSQRDAEIRLFMGLALGVMNIGFMAVLVYFIRKNVRMMDVIAEQNATLELRVSERTAQLSQKTSDINAMLQNMKLGVSTVTPGNRIHPEYSNYLRNIFCIEDLANKDLVESFFGKSDVGVDAREQVTAALASILGEEAMMFDFNGHLLVRELRLESGDGTHKILQMDWSPILNEQGQVDKVLLITQDVTHLRELEEASAQQKAELDIIARIIRISIGKFNSFVESAQGFIAANRRLIADGARDPDAITALFRNMHTIKGNARTFEFSQITDVAHLAEQTYDYLRKNENAAWNPELMLAELDAVEAAVLRYVSINEDKLGRKGRASDLLTTRGSFVANEELVQIRSMAAALAVTEPNPGLERLKRTIDNLGLVSLERLVSGSVDSLSSLAAELKKPAPEVQVNSGQDAPQEIAFNSQFAEALKSSLMHILRNSLDHGIEAPQERQLANKPERGTVHVSCVRSGEKVELHIGDDGRGLALHKLYEKGVAAGIFDATQRPSRESIAEIIFRSGLSTSAQVTQVSGRGVGMEAARTFLEEQGAKIRVELQSTSEKLDFTPFEFVIEVPATAYTHAV